MLASLQLVFGVFSIGDVFGHADQSLDRPLRRANREGAGANPADRTVRPDDAVPLVDWCSGSRLKQRRLHPRAILAADQLKMGAVIGVQGGAAPAEHLLVHRADE